MENTLICTLSSVPKITRLLLGEAIFQIRQARIMVARSRGAELVKIKFNKTM